MVLTLDSVLSLDYKLFDLIYLLYRSTYEFVLQIILLKI